MKITLPQKENMRETSGVDPTKFYYMPVARTFYLSRFADALRLLGGSVDALLDVGCGSGIFLKELRSHCNRLYGCDIHPHLDQTTEMLTAESIDATLTRADARDLPFKSESMDAIIAMSVLEHLHDLQPTVDEFYRILRPGGVAVIGIPMSNVISEALLQLAYTQLDGYLEDEHVQTHTDIINVFGRKFVFEAAYNIPRLLPEVFRLYRSMRFRKA